MNQFEQIDKHLDAVLRASGSGLRHYSMQKTIDEMRAAMAAAVSAGKAADDVLAERHRQIVSEGWTPDHDDGYKFGELAAAASCYAIGELRLGNWPFELDWWKPSDDRRRDLVKAAALLLAEIERIDRRGAA